LGIYITDEKTNLTYWFGVNKLIWQYFREKNNKNYLLAIQVWFEKYQRQFNNVNSKGIPIIDPTILAECGFEHYGQELEWVYPLADSSDNDPVTEEKLADILVEILTKVRNAVLGNNDDQNAT
jgi:hypothetical protein